ncbi:MAG: NADPH-dependent F420 reductase, partial [Halobacteriales archaeon]
HAEAFEGVLVSPVVPMERRDGVFVYSPGGESATADVVDAVDVPVAGAFHNVAAAKLVDMDADLGLDVLVFGDVEAKDVAIGLVDDVGASAVDAGGLAVASQVEALTPLLINVGVSTGRRNLGFRLV